MPDLTRREALRRCALVLAGLTGVGRPSHAAARAPGAATARRGAARACLEGSRIRWIVGWTPGGGFDAYSRLAETYIERSLDAQIVIENVPGAGGRVGARRLARARPDGRTLGILNGSGFLWNRSPDSRGMPDLARDFTILARVAMRQQVILAGGAAGMRTLRDLVALARRRNVVVGVTSPDSASFASLAVVTELLGTPTEFVAGYPGSREVMLGLQRGDFDLTSMDLESFLQATGVEGVYPLLQITGERAPHPELPGVPHLMGPDGLISRSPELFGDDVPRARSLAEAVATYLECGRLIAGPGGMDPALRDCLEEGIHGALSGPEFAGAARRAGRSIAPMPGAEIRREIPAYLEAVRPVAPVAAAAAQRIR